METFIRGHKHSHSGIEDAVKVAAQAWAIGHLALSEESAEPAPAAKVTEHLQKHLGEASIEAAILEYEAPLPASYRALSETEVSATLD